MRPHVVASTIFASTHREQASTKCLSRLRERILSLYTSPLASPQSKKSQEAQNLAYAETTQPRSAFDLNHQRLVPLSNEFDFLRFRTDHA